MFGHDLRYAVRSLAGSPAFALTAVLTVALGVGVNTALFSLIHQVLLDPLPYREPERLVHVAETHPEFLAFQTAAPDFADWRKSAKSFEQMAAHTFEAMNKWVIIGDGAPEPVQVVQASHELLSMLGIRPLLGRVFTAEAWGGPEHGGPPDPVGGHLVHRGGRGAAPPGAAALG